MKHAHATNRRRHRQGMGARICSWASHGWRVMTETNGSAESLTLTQYLTVEAITAGLAECPRHPGAALRVHRTHDGIAVTCLICGGLDLDGAAQPSLIGEVVTA